MSANELRPSIRVIVRLRSKPSANKHVLHGLPRYMDAKPSQFLQYLGVPKPRLFTNANDQVAQVFLNTRSARLADQMRGLDRWARRVRMETESNLYRFNTNRAEFTIPNSTSAFSCSLPFCSKILEYITHRPEFAKWILESPMTYLFMDSLPAKRRNLRIDASDLHGGCEKAWLPNHVRRDGTTLQD